MTAEYFKVQTAAGRCPTHGNVQASKEVPSFSWPVLVYLFQQVRNDFRPLTCQECGQKVKKIYA